MANSGGSIVLAGLAQNSKPLADAGIVTCENESSGPSAWVTSKAGLAAPAELRVSVSGTGNHRRCVTSWKLHVRERDGKQRLFTVAEREDTPKDDEWIQENSFEIEGWSKDGKLLLISQIEAQGDWDKTTPIVFNFNTNGYHRVELYPLFKRLIPAGCYVVYRILGFNEEGQVVVSALSTDDDREDVTKACFPESRWTLNLRGSRITPLRNKK